MSKKLYAALVVKHGLKGQGERGIHDIIFVGAKSKKKAISKIAAYEWLDPLWLKKSRCMISKIVEVTGEGLSLPSVHSISIEGSLQKENKVKDTKKRRRGRA